MTDTDVGDYSIYTIQTYDKIEQLGTKEKFWFYTADNSISRLCKIGRPGTGENWAEKVTSEIAKLLTIPCAKYDFAIWNKKKCVVSDNFVPEYCRLIHGNELLEILDEDYPKEQRYKVAQYNLPAIEELFVGLQEIANLPLGYKKNTSVKSPIGMFISYLLFDCLISNQDRHHENWGIIYNSKEKKYYLAPTYDHASSLGCRVSDEERKKRLSTTDKRYNIEAFVKRAKTPIYSDKSQRLDTLSAFLRLAAKDKLAANYWLKKLNIINRDSLKEIVDRVPDNLISCAAAEFAVSVIEENKNRRMNTREQLKLWVQN